MTVEFENNQIALNQNESAQSGSEQNRSEPSEIEQRVLDALQENTPVQNPAVEQHLNQQSAGKLNEPIQYTDGYSYEVPRPFLTLQQAAQVLGKSLRSLERSLLGRWGNKLPDGWVARKMRTENGDEWRILPPPGFRVKLNGSATISNTTLDSGSDGSPALDTDTEIARRRQWMPERHTLDQPAIVIERTEEVESLLRELVVVQKALAEERRLHLDDLKMINQMQSSMRLLEVNAVEQARAQAELVSTKAELEEYKTKYNRLVHSRWWQRLFQSQF